jgi:hypothetical protein
MLLCSPRVTSEDAKGNWSPKVATRKPRIPRAAALIAGLTRPNERLITAARAEEFSLTREMLNDQKDVVWLN